MLLQAMVKHIELWLIEKLVPFARNPRTHSDAQIAQIAASIAETTMKSRLFPVFRAAIPMINALMRSTIAVTATIGCEL